MLKAKKYDWKDSNMALFGSDTEKKVSLINFVNLREHTARLRCSQIIYGEKK